MDFYHNYDKNIGYIKDSVVNITKNLHLFFRNKGVDVFIKAEAVNVYGKPFTKYPCTVKIKYSIQKNDKYTVDNFPLPRFFRHKIKGCYPGVYGVDVDRKDGCLVLYYQIKHHFF